MDEYEVPTAIVDDRGVTDDMLASMISVDNERKLFPDESSEALARRLMREKAPEVAAGLIRMAMFASSERIRVDASKYILDRVLGPVNQTGPVEEKSPIEMLIDEITTEIN